MDYSNGKAGTQQRIIPLILMIVLSYESKLGMTQPLRYNPNLQKTVKLILYDKYPKN